MKVERTIEETAAGATRSVLVECSLCSVDDTLITGKTCIGIGAEHQHLMAAHFNFCTLLALNGAEVGIHISLHELLRLTIVLVFFL